MNGVGTRSETTDGQAGTGTGARVVAEVRGLRVWAGERLLVDGVSLQLRAGRVTALVGPSGSGKTTTGLALLGQAPPGARLECEAVLDVKGAYVPQHPAAVLNPARRAGALLYEIAARQERASGGRRRGRRAAVRARVRRALQAAQLSGEHSTGEALLRRFPHQLSGGQQQRVVLAQALLLGAQVVVADEPTTGQDAVTKRRIVAELRSVARQGIAVLLLTHDLDVVGELADEVVTMREGRVVGSSQEWEPPSPRATPTVARGAAPAPSGTAADLFRVRIEAARYRDRDCGTVCALRDIRLAVPAGQALAVVGRSGSGKTTLGRCVAGLHRDWAGEVGFDGTKALPRNVRSRTPTQLAAVQYVFQDARGAFDEHRPVLAQVARTAVRLRGARPQEAAEEARATLARVGVDDGTAARLPGQLSGGQLQRAALARALLARPRVLVCDEVTSGLDSGARTGVLDLLAGLSTEEGMRLLLITHDLETASLAHRMAVLDGGALVEEGETRTVLGAPEHSVTASLVRAWSPQR
ncbi:ABC transporter ATP-binding protein [Streptomyces sp. 3N207]|uniref:ABC transporter ATP-binding protein n=1 Tax=Streptomyces sp. 3N207 TaxID=3457417 RepID=UPI003FD353A2